MKSVSKPFLVSGLSLAVLSLLTLPAPARAGDQVLYQPAPAWVLPPPATLDLSAPASQPSLRLFDTQSRIDHGEVWSYTGTAVRIDTPEALTGAGTLALSWAPDHGDLIIHAISILRGGKRIDVLAGAGGSGGARFTVLRREQQLETLELNGQLTATLQVEGLQVGDVLEARYSVTQRDPVLQGRADVAALLLAEPARLGFGRVYMVWRDDDRQHWKTYLDGVNASEGTVSGGWRTLTVAVPVPKQPDQAREAPGRYRHPPILEMSDFADWADVSRTMAPLYRIDTPGAAIAAGGDLDRQVAAIAAATADPRRRVAMALQLVQDKVRYFAIGMDGGNLIPQTPEQTWAKRYGDCKAKTLLLLAILHRLGIDAEPALANLDNGDLVHDRLPSVMAFNHVFVLAHVAGAALWLDGTGMGSREADLDDVPPYGWVLPVRAAGADLLQAPPKVPARSAVEMSYQDDMRGGLTQLAPSTLRVLIRGGRAGQLNARLADLDAEARADVLRKLLVTSGSRRIFLRPNFTYDAAAGEAVVTAEGVLSPRWKRADSRYTYQSGLIEMSNFPDRSRTIWQTIPVDMGPPAHDRLDVTILLPRHGEGIAMEGVQDETLAGAANVHAELSDGTWRCTVTELKDGAELPAAAIPERRREDAAFAAKAPRLRTDADYPAPWQGVEAARRGHLYDRTIAILGQLIAEKPDDPQRYLIRAGFYASIFERQKAIDDFGKVLALQAEKGVYRDRASLYTAMGNRAAALADLKSAFDLDPSDMGTLSKLTRLLAQTGGKDDALARIDQALANGGDNEAFYTAMKAEVLAWTGDAQGSIALMDAALEKRSGNAGLLNERCWFKGLLNVDLEGAAADCSRAIQISDTVAPEALDSRALVRFRQKNMAQALADVNAAIDLRPGQAGSYFLRALIERATGQNDAAARDMAAAHYLFPAIEENYTPFGLRW